MSRIPTSNNIFEVSDSDNLARNLFTPFHYDTKKNKIKHAAFHPPKKEIEISVLRLNQTSSEMCVEIGHEQEKEGRKYIGYASFLVSEFKSIFGDKAHVHATPQSIWRTKRQMPFHADIIYAVAEHEQAIAPEYLELMKELSKTAMFFKCA